jgi:hypothetical protein
MRTYARKFWYDFHGRETMLDRGILEAALEGLLAKREEIDQQIATVRRMLEECPKPPGEGKRNLSPEARQKIKDAQKRRWDGFRAEKAKKQKGKGD